VRLTAHGWWLADAGDVAPRPPLADDVAADVVVVGGGFAGMWTAWHVLERAPGARVVVLEADRCGHGPSGRNGGFVDNLWHAAPRLRERFGDEAAVAVGEASGESVRAIGEWCAGERVDAWYRMGGQIVASAAPAQDGAGRAVAEACAALGVPGEAIPLSAAEVRRRCDSPVLRAGTYMPTAATVHPARLALGLRERLVAHGARVHEGSRVRALRVGPGGVRAHTAGGSVRARAAVLAGGCQLLAAAPLRRALTTVSSHLVMTEPVPDVIERAGWTGGEAITDARSLLHYFRTTPDGRIAFGWAGGRIGAGGRVGGHVERDAAIARRVRADLVRFFPDLAHRRVVHAWGGPIDASPTHLPTLESLPGGPAWAAYGFTGNGVGPSHLAGRVLAALALDERDRLTRLALVDPPPVRVPPEPLRWLGATLIRAGLERKERAEESGRAPDAASAFLARVPELIGLHIGR